MHPIHHPGRDDIVLCAIFYALGDPVRLEIVRNLASQGELSCNAAVATIKLSKSTLSHHFRILREAGLVWSRKEGTQHVNTLRTTDLEAKFPGLLRTIVEAVNGQADRKTSV